LIAGDGRAFELAENGGDFASVRADFVFQFQNGVDHARCADVPDKQRIIEEQRIRRVSVSRIV
jgi:hypothetical protein